jgi:adenylate cyclase
VKGKLQPVTIYELLDRAENRQKYDSLLEGFGSAMAAYREQNWDEAVLQFGTLLTSFPDDGPTQIFLQRALDFRERAPEPGWDGVHVMKSK